MPKPQLNSLSINTLTAAFDRYETVDVNSFAIYGRPDTLAQLIAFMGVVTKERPEPGINATLWGRPYVRSTEVPEGAIAIGYKQGYGHPTPADFSSAISRRIEGDPPEDERPWSYVLNLT